MKHFYTFFTLFLVFFNLNAGSLFEEYKTKITKVDGDLIYFDNSDDIKIGSSGIVVRDISSDMTMIVAKVIVISKDGLKAIGKVGEFTALKHEKLPSLNVKPRINDNIVLNYLYDKVLPITPNVESFEDVVKKYPNLTFIHPDILSTELIKSKDESPTYESFGFACQKILTNLLYFAIEDRGYFVDCNSFKILKEENIKDYKKEQTPYYTRIKEDDLNTYTFGFGTSKIKNYNKYYSDFLKDKNDK